MASLQNTTVPNGGYYRVGTSTDNAYVSSGGPYAMFGNGVYYNGAAWVGAGPFLQLYNYSLLFRTEAVTFLTPFSVSAYTTEISSTTTTINGALGVGAAAGTGKILVNAGGTSTPFLEVTNCLGDGRVVGTYPTFSGYLGIKIGSSVGPATSVTAGTYYIRLWDE